MASVHPIVYEDDDVRLSVEMCNNIPLLHCSIKKWTPGTFKRLRSEFQQVIDAFNAKGHQKIFAPDMNNKTTKFAKMFGFTKTDYFIIGEDKQIRGVLEWKQSILLD